MNQRQATPLTTLRAEMALRIALLAVLVAFAAAIGISLGGLVLFALALPIALIAAVAGLAFWRRGQRVAATTSYALAGLSTVATVAGFIDAIG
jgi:hypothetical protein